ncbi:MAG TPA: ABC transporter permease [Candidatus Lokiarchaeia archaeon]
MNYGSINNIWMLTKKNITLYIKKGPVLIFGLMFPFFIIISWILGRNISLDQIFIGIVAMTSFFTATAVSPVILPIETREKSLERILSAPISLNEILLGIIIASTLYSVVITSLIAIVFIALFPVLLSSLFSIFLMLLGIFLMGILGSLIGLLLSAIPTDQLPNIMVLMNLIKFPLLFIGGIFIPLKEIPSSVTFVYFISPLTFLTELLRGSVNQTNIISSEICVLILCIWIIVLFTLNYILHRKTMPKRFSETDGGPKMMMMKKQ